MINRSRLSSLAGYIGKNKTVQLYIFLPVVAIASIYYYFNNPGTTLYPPCPFLFFTGYFCPGCGSSRAFHQLLHGNIGAAMGFNPLMVVSIPFILYLFISYFEIRINGRLIAPRIVFGKVFYTTMFGIIFVYWIIRNIPVYPFVLLAP